MVADTVGLAVHGRPQGLDPAGVHTVFRALLRASEDYAVDSRGDVGSWVRRAAVDGLLALTSLVLRFPGTHLVHAAPLFPGEGGPPPPVALVGTGTGTGTSAGASAGASVGTAQTPAFVLSPAGGRGVFLVQHPAAAVGEVLAHGRARSGPAPYRPPTSFVPPEVAVALVRGLARCGA
jgi:hypothetical protein